MLELVQPRPFEGRCGVAGDRLDEAPRALVGDAPRRELDDDEDADRASLDQERQHAGRVGAVLLTWGRPEPPPG